MPNAVVLIRFTECPRNVLLRYRLEDYLKTNGYEIVSPANIRSCDLIVALACGLTLRAQNLHIGIIEEVKEEIRRQKSKAVLVVAGCLPGQAKTRLAAVHDGPAIGYLNLNEFDKLIGATTPIEDVPYRHYVKSKERKGCALQGHPWKRYSGKLARRLKTIHHMPGRLFRRYGRRIGLETRLPFDFYQMGDETWCVVTSMGCSHKCSYCLSRPAKGYVKSRPPETVLEEVREGVQKGFKWVSLIADDNGSFGKDIGTSFEKLLGDLARIEGDFSFVIDSLSGMDLNRLHDVLMELGSAGKLKRITVALQHVNIRILESMNRPYDVAQFKRNVKEMTDKIDGFVVDFHFLPGYPGETEEEFQELLSFAEWILAVNPESSWKAYGFTPMPGTPAAKLPGQLPTDVILDRTRRLLACHTRPDELHRFR